MIPFRASIGFRLLGMTTILLTIPLLVDSFIFLEKQFETETELAREHLMQTSRVRIDQCAQVINDQQERCKLLAHFLNRGAPPAEINETLQQLSAINDHEGIALVRPLLGGKVVLGSSFPSSYDLTSLMQPLLPLSAEQPLKTTFMLDAEERPLLVSLYGIFEKETLPTALLFIASPLDKVLPQLVQGEKKPYPMACALLFGKQGMIPSDSRLPREKLMGALGWHAFSWEGREYISYLQPILQGGAYYVVYAQKWQAFGLAVADFFLVYGSYFLILLMGFGIAYVGTKRLARPIGSLSMIMQAIKEGNLKMRYRTDSLGFEINRLGLMFNHTIESLIENEKALEEERLRKEMLSKELKLGQEVQLQLLPKHLPRVPGVQIATLFLPAIDVGGDFFDVFTKKEGEVVIAVADASGKGVQACLYSLTLKNMLKTMVFSHSEIHEAMRCANNLFYEDTGDTGMFVTVFMAQYDPKTHIFEYSSCGHNPPLLYRKEEGSVTFLEGAEIAMGFLIRDEKQPPKTLRLNQGDVVVLYSDGVTEAHNIENKLFTEERLVAFMKKHTEASAQEITSSLIEEVQLFAGKAKQHDDITIVVMKVEA